MQFEPVAAEIRPELIMRKLQNLRHPLRLIRPHVVNQPEMLRFHGIACRAKETGFLCTHRHPPKGRTLSALRYAASAPDRQNDRKYTHNSGQAYLNQCQ